MSIRISVAPTWDTVQYAIAQATSALTELNVGQEVIEATKMCVSELVENAVKYGAKTPDDQDIQVVMDLEPERVEIRVSNGIRSIKNFEHARNALERIKDSDDHMALYIGRLREMLTEASTGASQLGLYRIAYEGQFALEYSFEDGVFEVVATRNLP